MSSIAQRKLNARLAASVPPPPPEMTDDQKREHLRASAHLGWVLTNLKAALKDEWFLSLLQSTSSIVLRDDAVIIRTLHNPTTAAVSVTFSLDPGSPAIFSATLAAGQTQEIHLPMPRVAGYVGSGVVTITGLLTD